MSDLLCLERPVIDFEGLDWLIGVRKFPLRLFRHPFLEAEELMMEASFVAASSSSSESALQR
jgi:hypothetical protein